MTVPMLRILPAPWDFKMSGRPGSDSSEDGTSDKYAPLRKLAMAHSQPPRNPNKPFTSFSINDILHANGRNAAAAAAAAAAASKSAADKVNNNIAHLQQNGHHSHHHQSKQNSSKLQRQNFARPPPAHRNNNVINNHHNHPMHPRHHQRHPGLVTSSRIVRPWDASPPLGRSSEASSDADDEEINVDEDDDEPMTPSSLKDVSPLDALMEMANKTFQGLETSEAADAKRREQAALFGKHSTPKKRRKSRTAFTNQQIYELEKRFLYQKYLTPADRDEIAQNLGLTNAQVITWFQNRRAKLKRDLEELKNDVVATTQISSVKSGSSDHEFDIDSESESGHPGGEDPRTPTKRSRSGSMDVDDIAYRPPTTSTPTPMRDSPERTEGRCESPGGEIVVDDKEEFSEEKES